MKHSTLKKVESLSELFGNISRNKVLEVLLENRDIPLSPTDIMKETKLSRSTCLKVLNQLYGEGVVAYANYASVTGYLIDTDNEIAVMVVQLFDIWLKYRLNITIRTNYNKKKRGKNK